MLEVTLSPLLANFFATLASTHVIILELSSGDEHEGSGGEGSESDEDLNATTTEAKDEEDGTLLPSATNLCSCLLGECLPRVVSQ